MRKGSFKPSHLNLTNLGGLAMVNTGAEMSVSCGSALASADGVVDLRYSSTE